LSKFTLIRYKSTVLKYIIARDSRLSWDPSVHVNLIGRHMLHSGSMHLRVVHETSWKLLSKIYVS